MSSGGESMIFHEDSIVKIFHLDIKSGHWRRSDGKNDSNFCSKWTLVYSHGCWQSRISRNWVAPKILIAFHSRHVCSQFVGYLDDVALLAKRLRHPPPTMSKVEDSGFESRVELFLFLLQSSCKWQFDLIIRFVWRLEVDEWLAQVGKR